MKTAKQIADEIDSLTRAANESKIHKLIKQRMNIAKKMVKVDMLKASPLYKELSKNKNYTRVSIPDKYMGKWTLNTWFVTPHIDFHLKVKGYYMTISMLFDEKTLEPTVKLSMMAMNHIVNDNIRCHEAFHNNVSPLTINSTQNDVCNAITKGLQTVLDLEDIREWRYYERLSRVIYDSF